MQNDGVSMTLERIKRNVCQKKIITGSFLPET